MKLTGYVLDDVEKPWAIEGKTGKSRIVTVLDRDPGEHRLLQPLKMKIKEGDVLAGAVGSLRDAVVEIAITRFDQGERTKEISIAAIVLSVAGSMQFKAVPAEKKG